MSTSRIHHRRARAETQASKTIATILSPGCCPEKKPPIKCNRVRFDNFGGNKTKQTKFLGLLPELNTADKGRHDMVYVEKNKARDVGTSKGMVSPREITIAPN